MSRRPTGYTHCVSSAGSDVDKGQVCACVVDGVVLCRTLWHADVDVPAGSVGDAVLVCKATDASYNVQPDSVDGIWNLRGINNNAWYTYHAHARTIMPR